MREGIAAESPQAILKGGGEPTVIGLEQIRPKGHALVSGTAIIVF